MAKIKYDNLEFHPLTRNYPLLDGYDMQCLAESIVEAGLNQPISIHKGSGRIIDGRCRYQALSNAKVEYSSTHFVTVDISEADLPAWIENRNLHRRHLSEAEQFERREARNRRIIEMRRRGLSIRAIADEEGTNHTAVGRIIKDAAEKGEEFPKTVKGLDGKEHKACKPAPVLEYHIPAEDIEGVFVGEIEGDLRDPLGAVVPQNLVSTFEGVGDLLEATKLLSDARDRLSCVLKTPAGEEYRNRYGSMELQRRLADAARELVASRPHSSRCPCWFPAGNGHAMLSCNRCRGKGWLSHAAWSALPQHEKVSLETAVSADGRRKLELVGGA